jgi:ATP-dependent Clp protease ATP-binding subunit ClpA
MKVSAEVEIACSLAASEAQRRRHDVLTVEHLLFALLHDDETQAVVGKSGGDVEAVKQLLERCFDHEMDRVPGRRPVTPTPSRGFQRVLQRAALHVESAGKEELRPPNLLVAIFSESDSPAVQALETQGVTRYDVVNYLSHGVSSDGDEDDLEALPAGLDDEDPAEASGPTALERYTVNLNDRAAAGDIEPLVGREKELYRAIQVLARRRKHNPLFVGDAGVGKTALVEGLAARLHAGDVPEPIQGAVVFALDLGALLAGAKFAGSTSGSTLDAANLLKPTLASGKLRCIGATTFEDYRGHVERDHALARRFQKIEVLEPSLEETVEILKGLQPHHEEFHAVTYTAAALEAAAKLAQRHLPDRRMPDKAIDLMDEAGADAKLSDGAGAVVDETRIEAVVARMAQIPPRQVSASDKNALRELESELGRVVFGQDEAIAELATAIRLSRAGLRPPEKPVGSYLFTGPTGVGKTEVARGLAQCLGIELIRFDMSEYMERHTVSRLIGAPPGYVGYDRGGLLTEAVVKTPHAVLLLDEIEKAHADVFSVLLQVMDHGTLTDTNGKRADFRHVILIMTSNVGAADLARKLVGFGQRNTTGSEDIAYRNTFSPEFRNRLDARIRFNALDPQIMGRIVDKFMGELRTQLAEHSVTIELEPKAREHFAEQGHDPDNGARPLARLLQDELKRPLANELLFGALQHGGHVRVGWSGTEITLHLDAPAKGSESAS